MNLFILDNDPVIAAQSQCDVHVNKMIVESGQMLSTVHRMLDGTMERRLSKSGKVRVQYWKLPDEREDILYKACHFNHPCTIWTRENCCNYTWHYKHFIALCNEYTYRTGKSHMTYEKLGSILQKKPNNIPHDTEMTPFKLAMKSNPECMLESAVDSYRAFYQTKQSRFKMKWTKREKPEWFKYAV